MRGFFCPRDKLRHFCHFFLRRVVWTALLRHTVLFYPKLARSGGLSETARFDVAHGV